MTTWQGIYFERVKPSYARNALDTEAAQAMVKLWLADIAKMFKPKFREEPEFNEMDNVILWTIEATLDQFPCQFSLILYKGATAYLRCYVAKPGMSYARGQNLIGEAELLFNVPEQAVGAVEKLHQAFLWSVEGKVRHMIDQQTSTNLHWREVMQAAELATDEETVKKFEGHAQMYRDAYRERTRELARLQSLLKKNGHVYSDYYTSDLSRNKHRHDQVVKGNK
jgi:hypothetical protein